MTSAPLLGSRGGSAGEQVGARLAAAREGLAAVPEDLVEVSSDDLAELASLAAGVLAAAEAARARVGWRELRRIVPSAPCPASASGR